MEYLLRGTHTLLIDEEDARFLSGWNWQLHRTCSTVYARGYREGEGRIGGKYGLQPRHYLHRLILGAAVGTTVDHINGNGLDNRRDNLRLVTRSENNANRFAVQSKTSSFKGVHLEKWTGRWRAEIVKDGRRYRLGRFDTAEEAAAAYDKKARKLFPGIGHGAMR